MRLARLAFWGAVAFSFVMAALPHPPPVPGRPGDKLQHIMAFATMAGLGAAAYARTPLLRLGAWLSAFGVLIELAQLIPVLGRDSDWRDWLADTLAVAAVLTVARALRR